MAKQTRSKTNFTTIRVEGAILPADLLERISKHDKDIKGLREEEDYHLSGEKFKDAITQSWNRLRGAWTNFQNLRSKLTNNDTGTTITREKWLLPLFQQLGYGRLNPTKKSFDIDEKSYPISHLWQQIPIHLVGCNIDLDKRSLTGASRSSSHSMLQEFLNRSKDYLWAFVSNGLKLRILRDNVSLTRQAYVEFDLESMMQGEIYPDFVLLWLLCHESRVESEKCEDFWLEKWSKTAQEQGTRFLEKLRKGVETAISQLGSGFLAHPNNKSLRTKLQTGKLNAQDYYRQLLRLVYRLLFLFVAEDRDLLLDPNASNKIKERYTKYYSTIKLRKLAGKRKGTKHSDLWQGLRIVMQKLGNGGCAELALPALGSFLFSNRALPDLEGCEIDNITLLETFRALAHTEDGNSRRPVDYKNLRSEELGSVYESLLELHPIINAGVDIATFELKSVSGNERKTTGSYYTPESLVQCLLDSALDPVVDEAIKGLDQAKAEAVILNLKVCDPACGSGHFLVAAAHRMAKRLASIRTGDTEPSPPETQKALRDVIGHCIYGVDINEMAVELCKVALWMEAIEPGKPLSFLEHHIQCGNSLLGTTPALMADGIPDEAFSAIEGDDKKKAAALKKQNKKEREGRQGSMFAQFEGGNELDTVDLLTKIAEIDLVDDSSISGIRRKQELYEQFLTSDYKQAKVIADAWCAAFVWKKTAEAPLVVTQDIFWLLKNKPQEVPPSTLAEIERLTIQYKFLHLHLAFPNVFRTDEAIAENKQAGWSSGFDVVLGNPPWERLQFEEKAFFHSRCPEIYKESSQAKRRKMIQELEFSDENLYQAWAEASRQAEAEAHFLRASSRFPLSAVDKFNLYSVFSELVLSLHNRKGYAGIIVKAGFISDKLCSDLFAFTLKDGRLVAVAEFENKLEIFENVHPQERFALVTLSTNNYKADFCFDNLKIEQLKENDRHIFMSYEDIVLLSPNTKNCPKFPTIREFEIAKKCYASIPPLIHHESQKNNWGVSIDRYINVSDFSGEILTAKELSVPIPKNFSKDLKLVPIYEGKLFHQYDHRYATYLHTETDPKSVGLTEKSSEMKIGFQNFIPTQTALRRNPLLIYKTGLLVIRDITNRTNERGVIATIIPSNITDYTVRVVITEQTTSFQLLLLSIFNSFIFDYLARQRIGGIHLSNYITEQTPTISSSYYNTHISQQFIISHTLELIYTAWDLEAFAKDCGYGGPPFKWDEERRFLIRAELDAAYFHLYGIARDDVDYIMETFPIVKRKDEKAFGDYRTKRVILEVYDAMAEAMKTGVPYQSIVSPPPADASVAHPPREIP